MKKIFILLLFLSFIAAGEINLDVEKAEKTGDLKITGRTITSISGGTIVYKLNMTEEGKYFLKFEATFPDYEKDYGYKLQLNGKDLLHNQSWDEGYLPTVIPLRKLRGNFWIMLYTVPIELKEGENKFSFVIPENSKIRNLKLIEAIPEKIKKEVEVTGTQFIFYKNDETKISFSLTYENDKKFDGLLSYYSVRLLDNKGEWIWTPGLRFVPFEILQQKKMKIDLKKGEKKRFVFKAPKEKYGTVSAFLILEEKDKILPVHILNYSVVFERDTDKFNYDGLFMASAGHEILRKIGYLKAMKKIGIDWIRYEVGWNGFEPKKGEFNWKEIDKFMNACRENKMYIMTLTEGAPDWAKPKGNFFDIPYKDFTIKLDWSPGREHYDDWKNAWKEYLKRYKDVCRALNVWNEPWEGGGISGWKSTGQHYRMLFKKVREARDEVDKSVKMVGADSSHNTNWKLFAAGMEDDIDVLSTHYELPAQSCYSPSLANYYGKEVWDTETWITWMGDSAAVRNILNEIALGWKKVSPFVTSLIFDKNGFPNTSSGWTSALSRFLNNKEYMGFAHPDRPPFVLLFKGKDESTAVVSTSLCGVYQWEKVVFWGQFFDEKPIMTIDYIPDLKVYDIYGNEVKIRRKLGKIYIPVDKNPKYITTAVDFDKFQKILSKANYENLRPVEIKAHQIGGDNKLYMEIRNVYPVKIRGNLKVKCESLTFKKSSINFVLNPVERKEFEFDIVRIKEGLNNYPAEIIVNTDKGDARLNENLVFCIIKKGKIVIDGKLDDWEKIEAKTIFLTKERKYENLILKAWYPWEKFIEGVPDFSAEVAFAYDENYFYGCARIKDKSKDILPSLLEGKNLHKFQNPPGDYVYAQAGPIPAASGDMIKLSLGPVEKKEWDRKYEVFPPDSPIYKFGHYLNALYQYLIYPTKDGKAEIMRVRTPDFYYLHPLPINYKFLSEKCKVNGAKVIVKVDENGYIYEFSIPWEELKKINPENKKRIRLSFQIQNNGMGNVLEFSKERSICSVNTLDFEPGWGAKFTCETEFEFFDLP